MDRDTPFEALFIYLLNIMGLRNHSATERLTGVRRSSIHDVQWSASDSYIGRNHFFLLEKAEEATEISCRHSNCCIQTAGLYKIATLPL
jgi:hypothetical protein